MECQLKNVKIHLLSAQIYYYFRFCFCVVPNMKLTVVCKTNWLSPTKINNYYLFYEVYDKFIVNTTNKLLPIELLFPGI